MSKESVIAKHVMRRVERNREKKEQYMKTHQGKSPVSSGMTVSSSAVVVGKPTGSLLNPDQEQAKAVASGDVSRIGSKMDNDQYRVSASPLAVKTGLESGMQTDATAEPDMPLSNSIRPVDQQVIEGTYGAGKDFRSQAKDAVLPATNRGPRKQMPGQKSSKFYDENGDSFVSTPVGLDSDAGN